MVGVSGLAAIGSYIPNLTMKLIPSGKATVKPKTNLMLVYHKIMKHEIAYKNDDISKLWL